MNCLQMYFPLKHQTTSYVITNVSLVCHKVVDVNSCTHIYGLVCVAMAIWSLYHFVFDHSSNPPSRLFKLDYNYMEILAAGVCVCVCV